MYRKKQQVNKEQESVYSIMNKWLYDGSKTTNIPEILLEDKTIGPQYILWYFRNSAYIVYFNEHFNNYHVFSLDKESVFRLLKQTVLLTGYKPSFFPKQKTNESKLEKILREKYPYLKKDDVNLLGDIIDNSDEKDEIYETFGLKTEKKVKTDRNKFRDITNSLNEHNNVKVEKEEKITLDHYLKEFVVENIS